MSRIAVAFILALVAHAGLLLMPWEEALICPPQTGGEKRVRVMLGASPGGENLTRAHSPEAAVSEFQLETVAQTEQALLSRPASRLQNRSGSVRVKSGKESELSIVRPSMVKKVVKTKTSGDIPEESSVDISASSLSRSEEMRTTTGESSEVTALVVQARPLYLRNQNPVYPQFARRKGWEGTVILRVLVLENGNVDEIYLHTGSGYRVLDKAALNAVKKWCFSPGTRNGIPLMSEVLVPIRFQLQ